MPEYRVELEAYAGPLDLLLFLVKRHEIDLHDIPVAKLTQQYLAYLEQLERIDINVAGEFLVMAATLLEIKSKMLLPRPEEEEGEDGAGLDEAISELDPRYELVQQLLAYKRFKDAAIDLDQRRFEWERRFPATPAKLPKDKNESEGEAQRVELDLEDVNIFDLTEAFASILASIGQQRQGHQVVYDDTPISLHAADIVDRLQRDGDMTFARVFAGRTRGQAIGLFLAMLELTRQRRLRIFQDRICGQIKLQLRPESDTLDVADDEAVDWRDPETGQMQYDWPDEEAKAAAERRAERRKNAVKKRFGQQVDEDFDDDEDVFELETGDTLEDLEAQMREDE